MRFDCPSAWKCFPRIDLFLSLALISLFLVPSHSSLVPCQESTYDEQIVALSYDDMENAVPVSLAMYLT